MKILLAGENGQVGWELPRTLSTLGEVIALVQTDMDLENPDAIRKICRNIKPNVISSGLGPSLRTPRSLLRLFLHQVQRLFG